MKNMKKINTKLVSPRKLMAMRKKSAVGKKAK
jgi:hypothetical protein